MTNNDRFLPNIIYEEYEYNDDFEKNENSLPTGIQEKDRTLNYKNDGVSFVVVAEFPSLYLISFVVFVSILVRPLNKVKHMTCINNEQMQCNFIDVLLLYYRHQHVSASLPAIFRMVFL